MHGEMVLYYMWTTSPAWARMLLASAEKSYIPPMCSVLHFTKLEGDVELVLTAKKNIPAFLGLQQVEQMVFSPHFTSLSVLSFLMPHCSFFTLLCRFGLDSTPAEVNWESPTDFIWLCLMPPAISPPFSYAWTQIPALTSQQLGSCLCIISPLTSRTLPRTLTEQGWGKQGCRMDTAQVSSSKENLWKIFGLDYSETAFSVVFPSLSQKIKQEHNLALNIMGMKVKCFVSLGF